MKNDEKETERRKDGSERIEKKETKKGERKDFKNKKKW